MADYTKQFEVIFDFISHNLDKHISARELSHLAGFSHYHFHRIFVAQFGIGIGKYIKLARFKQASLQLALRPDTPLIDIALSCGYENPSSFSREYKRMTGSTPSEFRKQPNWDIYNKLTESMNNQTMVQSEEQKMQLNDHRPAVDIVHFPATKVACLTHKGSPNKVMETVGRFIQWRKQYGPSPKISDTYNILYDDPAMVEPQDYRFDVCASLTSELKDNEWGVVEKTIPGGRCAVLRHVGSESALSQNIHYLYADWLHQSQESVRDYPCFIKRITFYPDVPEHETRIDIYLPLN